MKQIISIFLLFVVVSFLSCNQDKKQDNGEMAMKQRELDIKERELELKEKEVSEKGKGTSQNEPTVSTPKYYAKGYGTFPEGSNRYLTSEDTRYLDYSELKIMRNEIFARHGYIFKTEDMIQYFSGQSWYKPLHNDVNSSLTEIERKNVEYIKTLER